MGAITMDKVDIIPKLNRLNDHLTDLNADDRQFVTDMLNGERLLMPDILRIVTMRVPGEAVPVPTLFQDEMVSIESKYLTEVIWQYMPLEKFFALLSTSALHFSTLASMPDKGEGTLPQRARELSKAQLPEHFRNSNAGVSADDVLDNLECHRKHTVSISCWYMRETDSFEMWRDYAPRNGVAIRTTVSKLFSSLRKINETNIHIGRVIYYRPDEEDKYIMQAHLGSLYIKHAEPFQKEKEIRAIAPSGIYKCGIDIPVTLPILIERLMLSPELPEWAVPSFTEAMRKLGVQCLIEKSRAT
jgi:hypothetical protein